jgi:hypothetical protein
MRLLMIIVVYLLIAGQSLSNVALAQEGVDFELKSIRVTAYEALKVNLNKNRGTGVQEVLALVDTLMVSVAVEVLPKWTEEVKRADASAKDISLIDTTGQTFKGIGKFDDNLVFAGGLSNLSIRRPRNWKTKEKTHHWTGVFAVPKTAGALTLQLGTFPIDIQVPKEVTAFPKTADYVEIEVVSATFTDSAEKKFSASGGFKSKTKLSNPQGSMLAVKLRLRPVKQVSKPDYHYWHTRMIGLSGPGLGFTQTVGELSSSGELNTNVSHNLRRKDGKWVLEESTFLFAVPQELKTFTLHYEMDPVVQGTVGN